MKPHRMYSTMWWPARYMNASRSAETAAARGSTVLMASMLSRMVQVPLQASLCIFQSRSWSTELGASQRSGPPRPLKPRRPIPPETSSPGTLDRTSVV